ncbi:MAG: MFS transporter [Chloroflexi bacterium]|nr:MFS transporter [Chloroflexota bacterium]
MEAGSRGDLPDRSDRPLGKARQAGWARLFLAFETRSFRWFWGSLFFSSMAIGVRMLAQGWLVLELTNSPFWVGMVTGLQGVATVAVGAPGGALVDRLNRKQVLVWTHVASIGVALAIGVLAVTHHVALWHLLVASLASGAMQAVQMPASNALVYDVVGPRRLLNAMAARMVAFNLTRIIGSLIAGGLIASFGVGSSYLFAAGSTCVGILCLLPIKGAFLAGGLKEPFWQSVRQGVGYTWGRRDLRRLLLLSLLMETFGFSHTIMLPVMARDVLDVGAIGFGVLSSASGAGAMASNVGVALMGDYQGKGKLLGGTALVSGVSLLLFALSPWFALSAVLVGVAGAALMAYDVTLGTVFQLLVSDDVRGRVMGIYGLTFGFTPLGGLLAGAVASVAGAPVAIGLGGVVVVGYLLTTLKVLVDATSGSRRPAG